MDLVDRTSVGKVTPLLMASSVWGGMPGRSGGFMETWATTVEGAERLMLQHSDGFLALDETNLADKAKRVIREVIFRLAAGRQKVRYTDTGVTVSRRLVFLSSSNEPLAQLLAGSAGRVIRAAEVRLLSVPARASEKFGIFDRLPDGFAHSSAAVDHLNEWRPSTTAYRSGLI